MRARYKRKLNLQHITPWLNILIPVTIMFIIILMFRFGINFELSNKQSILFNSPEFHVLINHKLPSTFKTIFPNIDSIIQKGEYLLIFVWGIFGLYVLIGFINFSKENKNI